MLSPGQANDNTSKSSVQSQNHQRLTQRSPYPPAQLGLHENMLYREARSRLIQQGWQPNVQGDPPNLNDASVRELVDLGYEEVKDCSGTGLGPCRFEFTNAAGELLVVSAITKGARNRDRVVWRWFIEERTSGTQPPASAPNPDQALPFVGTRYFNFLGGTGTGQSMTIEQDGTTTVELHGTASRSIEYRGKFSNPMILPDGNGLLVRGDKIYSLLADGQIAQGCKGEGKPCESELYVLETPSTIVDGLYVLGGTDQGLEVAGDQYRYYDELGTQAWRPLSQLTAIQEGVVFDGNVYWCIPPQSAPGVCTENGWQFLGRDRSLE
ncbi:hypothetical protein [Pantanalinema sp. GBBB05]|uniref:hypothetical protein n=1 Tax=Pantanalinema sp. GBBB05 TaxID=2604139 RepID=UPI001DBF0D98|nr:hypothetical protein [Pantanalinema sp. GBBB05]